MKDKTPAKLNKVYKAFLDLMFYPNNPVDHIDNYVVEEVMGYGTALDEKIFGLNGVKDLAILQRTQAPALNFKYDLIPVYRKTLDKDGTTIIVDEMKISMQVEGEDVILNMRLSSVWRLFGEDWKLVHWHGSKAEYNSGGTDTWHTEEWQQKNKELQKQVDEKTAELQKQNRELEIQAALERVRSRTSEMQDSTELNEVVAEVYTELAQLGIDVHLSLILIYDWKTKHMEWWSSGQGIDKMPQRYRVQITPEIENHPWVIRYFNAQKNKIEFEFYKLEGEIKKTIDTYLFEQTDLKSLPDDFKQTMSGIQSVMLAEAFMKRGVLSISVFEELADSDIDLIKRFARVIDETFNRVEELRIAETSANEAKIEAALERVRARTMAMQNSEDLAGLSAELVKQVQDLGVETWFCAFNITDNASVGSLEWGSNGENTFPRYRTPREGIFLKYYEAGKKGETLLINEIGENECPAHYEYLCSLPGVGNQLLKMKEEGIPFPTSQIDHVAYFNYGYLLFITYEPVPESHEIFKRFAKVFEQSYTRFLDIKKAEEQTREAEIQLALERVRARSMAMHDSSEMLEVADVLFQQLRSLGGELWACGVVICNGDQEDDEVWFANENGVLPPIAMTHTEDPTHQKMYDGWKNKQELFTHFEEGKGLEKHYNYMLSVPSARPLFEEILASGMTFPTWQKWHAAYFSYGYLLIITLETYQEESIFTRFAKVFNQAYTRFLDLKKVEKQAREAQIEAGLERVRAASMAMHKSEELRQVVVAIDKEIAGLGISIDNSSIITDFSEFERGINNWLSVEGQSFLEKFHMPYPDDTIGRKLLEAINDDVDYYSEKYSKAEKNQFFRWLFKYSDFKKLPKERQKFIMNTPGWTRATVISRNSLLIFQRYRQEEFTEEESSIFKRFGKVFEQAYTRFLDLKKAEEQAREAEVELALERVRAKAMAMHKSEDLTSAVSTVFSELERLGFKTTRCGIGIFNNQNKKVDVWTISSDANSNAVILTGDEVLEGHPLLDGIFNAWQHQQDYSYVLQGQDFLDYYRLVGKSNLPVSPPKNSSETTKQFYHCCMFPSGGLFAFRESDFSSEAQNLMRRFADVFQLTFTRHLDLRKAEAQARKAQIEAALERVRARNMGMHRSEELQEVINLLFNEINTLGIELHSSYICTEFDLSKRKGYDIWVQNNESTYADRVFIPYIDGPYLDEFEENWNKKKSYIFQYSKKEKRRLFEHLFKNSPQLKSIPEERKKFVLQGSAYTGSVQMLSNSAIAFQRYNDQSFTPEEIAIQQRFGNVFEQTYTRFLDLKKAEAQAREAEIQLALERIRARTMAMQSSEELAETATEMFTQIEQLGLQPWSCGFHIFDHEEEVISQWVSTGDGRMIDPFETPSNEDAFQRFSDAAKRGEALYVEKLEGQQLVKHYQYLSSLPKLGEIIDKLAKEGIELPKQQVNHAAFFKQGYVMFITYDHVHEFHEIFKRFASVFEQTYTRFLDLQKAEALAREAQIEAALERVRSRSMGMQKSEELLNVVQTLYGEFESLKVNFHVVGIHLTKDTSKDLYLWFSTADGLYENIVHWPYQDIRIFNDIQKSIETGEMFEATYSKEETKEFFTEYFKLESVPQKRKTALQNLEYIDWIGSILPNSSLFLMRYTSGKYTMEEKDIVKRFARVFEQTYTRFLDLQKAEDQAKEAQIEVALERVRAQAMAMQNSDDLKKSTTILFEELEKLDLSVERSGIGIFDNETRDCQLWTTVVTPEGKKELTTGITSLTIHPMLIKTFDAWKIQETLPYILEGKELKDYYKLVSGSRFHLPDEVIKNSSSLPREYYLYTPFGAGGLYAFSEKELSDKEKQIIKRFADVYHLTYTRFEDLQQAEAQAREAKKQASLDRLRGEIASMRTSDDLDRITPVIWRELQALEVPFIRCGVFIVNEENKNVQVFLTTPEGKALAALNLSFDSNELSKNTVEHWRKKRIFRTHWTKQQFINWTKSMMDLGQVESAETYQGSSTAPESLNLHFIPFKQGMLYVGDSSPLTNDKLDLVKTLAEAFAIAYARYEDFKDLEDAKNEIELTLNELRSAQAQLIQAEKMASLGELTAGIAHEIQNPLNFVNNFSELNAELIDELKDELAAGNSQLVNEIADDIKQNEGKIKHHGTRAEMIVKGMLLHSRGSSGQKESTDINELADEYLRLSFHGFRAKDKSFNADFRLEADETLPKLNIVPQDIGRVMLNLINNAFHAVNEKAKSVTDNYKPMVKVSTSSYNSPSIGKRGIKITIQDNGPGIPEEVREKIFQPFFTTKPTGQGTGLGLSLSYDIVKAHGGELTLETKEGEGCIFKIVI